MICNQDEVTDGMPRDYTYTWQEQQAGDYITSVTNTPTLTKPMNGSEVKLRCRMSNLYGHSNWSEEYTPKMTHTALKQISKLMQIKRYQHLNRLK